MQIHELSSRRTTTEGLGAIVKGVADVAGRSVMQKYGGTAGGSYGNKVTGLAAQGAAGQMNQALVAPMAKQLQSVWTKQSLPALMAAKKATTPAEINQNNQIEELTNLVNGQLKFDYRDPAVDPTAQGGRAAAQATQRSKDITNLIRAITTHPPAGSGNAKSDQEYTTDFTELSKAMGALMSLSAFQGGGGRVAGGGVADPVANQLLKSLGVTPAEVTKFGASINQSGTVKPTGNTALDAFLRVAGIIK